MTQKHAGRWLRTGAASFALLASVLLAPAEATAVTCPPASVGGKAVGKIKVGSLVVPIKAVSMGKDGTLDSAPSNLVASVVREYPSLNAREGTTVLLWHSRYGVGCDGALNVLFGKPVGSRFGIINAAGIKRVYEITAATTVKKGDYWDDWFRWLGPRALTLITCTNLVDGKFTENYVITAVPV